MGEAGRDSSIGTSDAVMGEAGRNPSSGTSGATAGRRSRLFVVVSEGTVATAGDDLGRIAG
jgi:hypothetical protein